MLVEQGRYRAVICDHGLTQTSTGKDQVVITFSLCGMIDATTPGDLRPAPDCNRSIFKVLTDKSIEYVMQDLRSIGWEGTSFAELDHENSDVANLIGKEIDVLCTHEEYQGKTQERWSLAGRGAAAIKAADSATIRRLDTLFAKHLKAGKAKPAAQPLGAPMAASKKTKPKSAEKATVPAWEADDDERTPNQNDNPF